MIVGGGSLGPAEVEGSLVGFVLVRSFRIGVLRALGPGERQLCKKHSSDRTLRGAA